MTVAPPSAGTVLTDCVPLHVHVEMKPICVSALVTLAFTSCVVAWYSRLSTTNSTRSRPSVLTTWRVMPAPGKLPVPSVGLLGRTVMVRTMGSAETAEARA